MVPALFRLMRDAGFHASRKLHDGLLDVTRNEGGVFVSSRHISKALAIAFARQLGS